MCSGAAGFYNTKFASGLVGRFATSPFENYHSSLDEHQARAVLLLNEVTTRIEKLLASDADYASFYIRGVVDQMCVLNNYLSLLPQKIWPLHSL